MLEREAFGNATVVAKLQDFHWVWIDRDHTPAIPRQFKVSAYPSILILGPEDENIHRWSGFLANEKFLASVDEAKMRLRQFQAGEAWDTPLPRAPAIVADTEVSTFAAPSDANPNGIVFCGGQLFVAQGDTLHRLDEDRKPVWQAKLPASARDLASDGKRLFVIPFDWTAGGPIHELDPETGKVVRSIVTEANKKNRYSGAFGVAWRDGFLWALESTGKLHRVDPENGEIQHTLDIGQRFVGGLDFDGEQFLVGSREKLHLVDPETGKVTKSIPLAYPVRALACSGGRVYLLEQPVFGFGRKHENIRIYPSKLVVHSFEL